MPNTSRVAIMEQVAVEAAATKMGEYRIQSHICNLGVLSGISYQSGTFALLSLVSGMTAP